MGRYISLTPSPWTTAMGCQMDYLYGLPKKLPLEKKNRKKYYPLIGYLF